MFHQQILLKILLPVNELLVNVVRDYPLKIFFIMRVFVFFYEGLLHRLCVMLTLTTIPADVLAETINTIGDVVRGNTENQQFLGSVMNTTSEIHQ